MRCLSYFVLDDLSVYGQVLVAEDPTNLCTSEATRSARESFIAVRITFPENIMSYMRVPPSRSIRTYTLSSSIKQEQWTYMLN
jgi:hypothetical protein